MSAVNSVAKAAAGHDAALSARTIVEEAANGLFDQLLREICR